MIAVRVGDQRRRVATVNHAWNGDSWLLTGVAGPTATHAIGAVLCATALIGFVALGGVVLGRLPGSWWTLLAIAASITSLAGLVLFPIAFPTVSSIGALEVDAAVLFAVLGFHWVPSDLAGS